MLAENGIAPVRRRLPILVQIRVVQSSKRETFTHMLVSLTQLIGADCVTQNDTIIVVYLNITIYVVSCAVPVGNVSWMLFQEGRSSNLMLRRGVGQAAHTPSNPHIKCAGVYCA